MSVWIRAEEILKAIQSDLDEVPPNWGSAAHSAENLRRFVPGAGFDAKELGHALQSFDLRIVYLKTDLELLQLGIKKQDHELTLRSLSSALRNVQELGLKDQ